MKNITTFYFKKGIYKTKNLYIIINNYISQKIYDAKKIACFLPLYARLKGNKVKKLQS